MNLLLFSHTFFNNSSTNKMLLEEAATLENLIIRNLSEIYKDIRMNVEDEIAIARKADRIIIQFPLFWYSAPAIFKEYQDLVFSASLKKDDNFFKNKPFKLIITAGAKDDRLLREVRGEIYLNKILFPLYESISYLGGKLEENLVIYSANHKRTKKDYEEDIKNYLNALNG